MKWLVCRDIRGRINALDLDKVVRILIDHRDASVYFWCTDGQVHGFRIDEVPIRELFEFLAVPTESQPILEHWSVGGDRDADRGEDL